MDLDDIGSWVVPPLPRRVTFALDRKDSRANVHARITVRYPVYLGDTNPNAGKIIETFDLNNAQPSQDRVITLPADNLIADIVVTALENGLGADFDFDMKIGPYTAIERTGTANHSSSPHDTKSFAGHYNMTLTEGA